MWHPQQDAIQQFVDALPPPVQTSIWGVWHVLVTIFAVAVIIPLKGLYLQGPSLGGYGFWGGADAADICAQVSKLSATSWLRNPERVLECNALIERKFTSFAWAVFALVYSWTLYNVASHFWYRFWVVRPVMAELRHTFRLLQDSGGRLQLPLSLRRTPSVTHNVNHTPRSSPKKVRRHIVWSTPSPKARRRGVMHS